MKTPAFTTATAWSRALTGVGATIAAGNRRIAQAKITLREPAESAGFVNGHPMLHNRVWPAIESDGSNAMDELVTMTGYDGEVSDVWSGDAEIDIFESPTEELSLLHPQEMIGGFYHRVGVSWKGGTTLRRAAPSRIDDTDA